MIVYVPAFVSFSITYICLYYFKTIHTYFPSEKKFFLWRGKIRTPSFLLSLQVRVLLTVALINHATNTFPCSFQSSRRLPVPSLLPSCTSSSWQLSPGCSWRVCSCTSCWWRFLRASTPGGSISTWWGTACLHWLWPCRQQWTTGATARTKCEWPWLCLDLLRRDGSGGNKWTWGAQRSCSGRAQLGGMPCLISVFLAGQIPHYEMICKVLFREVSQGKFCHIIA